MKRALYLLILFLVVVSFHSCNVSINEIFVSPSGNDLNQGTKMSPFATIERAMEEVNKMKSDSVFPETGIAIWFREGDYRITESIQITNKESGMPGAPVKFCAYPNEKVVFSGAIKIPNSAVKPVDDADLLHRIINKDVIAKIRQIDLASLGISDYGENQIRGGGVKSISQENRPPDFIINGNRLMVARWPNPGEIAEMGKIIDPGVDWDGRSGRGESDESSGEFVKEEPRGGTFTYSFNRPNLWQSDEVFVSGVLSETWVWSYVGVQLNKTNQQMSLDTPISYGLINNPGKNYFHFEDIPEEIDIPSEYWLDREKGILYFLPPEDFNSNSEISVNMLKKPMIVANDASWLTFSNIIFEGGRAICMDITGGEGISIEHCEIRNFLISAVDIKNGKNHKIESCHIHDIGADVLNVEGGDWESLTPSGIEITNNHIHNFGYYIPSSNCAISLAGVGVKVTHNRIHDAPHKLINFRGNDHVIMYNEMYDAVRDFYDAGAINCHLGYDPSQRGTLISSNYFHDIAMKMNGCKVIYTDGGSFEVTIEKNIFQNIGTIEVQNNVINNNTGSYINMRNNIFLNCTMPLKNYFYLSMANSLRFNMYRDRWKVLFDKYDFSKLPHGTKYPALLRFWEEEHELPTTNTFVNNLIFNTDVALLNGEYIMTARNQGIPIEELVDMSGNVVFTSDPGFEDFSNGNLTLKSDAAVFQQIHDFEEVPFSKMGLIAPVGPQGYKSEN